MRVVCAILFAALAACGEPAETVERSTPETYTILPSDLWRQVPDDICRARNPKFLADLQNRIQEQLPPEHLPNFEFVDFTVPDSRDIAILRFRITDGVMMVAGGAFDPETCAIGDLTLAEGTSSLALP